MMRAQAVFILFVFLFFTHTALADDGTCDVYADVTNAEMGTINAANPRVHFITETVFNAACPSATKECEQKAYVVPGNEVILNGSKGDFVCAAYIDRKGREYNGWLPVTSVKRAPVAAVDSKDWLGHWRGDVERDITIKESKTKDLLSISGEATWGSQDPERVKRGGVNIGNIDADVAPKGNFLSFASGETTMPYDKGDEFTCRVRMKRVGDYLLVDDNGNCGGHNVTFRSAYRRVKK